MGDMSWKGWGVLPEFKLLDSSFESLPVILKCLIWERCTDKGFNRELFYCCWQLRKGNRWWILNLERFTGFRNLQDSDYWGFLTLLAWGFWTLEDSEWILWRKFERALQALLWEPRPEIKTRRSDLCQTPENIKVFINISHKKKDSFYIKDKSPVNWNCIGIHLIASELRNNWDGRALAFPLLPGLQGKFVLLKLVAPEASRRWLNSVTGF